MSVHQLIQNYGLFWKSDDVFWGSGRKAGHLYGVLSTQRKGKHIDFRDQRGIYVLYADYDLVYVGQNGGQELIRRLRQHQEDDLANRWNRFSWFGMRKVNKGTGKLAAPNQAAHPPISNVLNHIEAILIHAIEPALNRQGGRFGKNVEGYLQIRDEQLGPSETDILKKLYENASY